MIAHVRVDKASKSTYWYANRIGQEFKVKTVWEHEGDLQFNIGDIGKGETGHIVCADCTLIINGVEFKPKAIEATE